MSIRTTLRICMVAAASFVSSQFSRAGSPVYVGQKTGHTVPINQIEHGAWNRLLKKYVNNDGMVNYKALKASPADMATLDQYLNHLSTATLKPQATKHAQLAFWINAYNAVTLKGILREYPTTSIRNHTAKLIGYNIWHDLKLHVGGIPYSLDHIEHKILRKMNEPRIHFAIVCASIGCPCLLNEAYVADRLDQQLELNAKDFFSRSQNFQYDVVNKRFNVSAILDWFGSDFGGNKTAQLKTISTWLPTAAARSVAASGGVSVKYLEYNWQLNSQ